MDLDSVNEARGNLPYSDTVHMQLSSVGGSFLWVKAALHQDGVTFPVAKVVAAEWDRQGYSGMGPEGLCWMAAFLGYKCWGMPLMTVLHSAVT